MNHRFFLLFAAFILISIYVIAQPCPDLVKKFTKTISAEGDALIKLEKGQYQQGIASAQEGAALSAMYGYRDGLVKSNNLIVRGYVQLLQYDSAMWYAQRSLDIIAQYQEEISPLVQALTYFGYGVTLVETGRYREGIDALQQIPILLKEPILMKMDFWDEPCMTSMIKSIQQFAPMQIPVVLGQTYTFVGDAYSSLQEPEQAVAYHLEAAAQHKKASNITDQANALINAGGAAQASFFQASTGADQSELYYQKALELLKKTRNTALQQSLVHHLLSGKHSFGNMPLPMALTHIDSAIFYMNQADSVQCFQLTRLTKTQLLTLYQTEKAGLLSKLHRIKESNQLIEVAGKMMEQLLNQTPEFVITLLPTSVYSLLSITSIRNQNPVTAKYYFDKSWELLYPDTPVEAILEKEIPIEQITHQELLTKMLLYVRGKIAELEYTLHPKQGSKPLKEALAFYEASIDLHNNRLNTFTISGVSPTLQEANILSLNAQYASLYNDAFLVAYLLYNAEKDPMYLEKAHIISEKSKSYILRKNLRDIKQVNDVPDAILAQEAAWRDSMLYLKKQVVLAYTKNDSNALYFYNQQFIKAWEAVKDYIELVRTKYPAYYQLIYSDYIPSLAEAQQSLMNDTTAILGYSYFSDTLVFITLLKSKGQAIILSVKTSNSITQLVDKMMQVVANDQLNGDKKAAETYLTSAAELYNILIDTLESLSQLKDIKRLIIIKDGPLQHLNFELLLNKPGSQLKKDGFRESKRFPYLLRKYAISYAPSVSILMEAKDWENKDSNESHLLYGGFEPDYNSWPQSHYSFKEVNNIRSKYFRQNSEAWLGQKATKAAFKEATSKFSFEILHFSGHSVLNEKAPLDTRMLFSFQSADNEEDNVLTTGELYSMRVNAKLAILGSCNSGTSRFMQPGEGLLTLSSGFAYAGCPGIIMSQWTVTNDVASNEIMDYFFKFLKQNYSIDAALRQAKLDYLDNPDRSKSEVAPNVWAPFVAWGYMRSFRLN